jgi:hypothetical protein
MKHLDDFKQHINKNINLVNIVRRIIEEGNDLPEEIRNIYFFDKYSTLRDDNVLYNTNKTYKALVDKGDNGEELTEDETELVHKIYKNWENNLKPIKYVELYLALLKSTKEHSKKFVREFEKTFLFHDN